MKILVVNGSPAGEESITLQTLKYLEIKYPEHEYKVIHAARTIRKLEKDFSEAEDLLLWAELIVFADPVYTFLVPSQLHRFLQLMKESRIDFASKYAAQVSTSKHFYDVTAHEFIRENCLDLGFMYLPGLSADMEDLLTEQGRKDARMFFEHLMFSIGEGMTEQREKEGTGEPALFEASLPEKSTEKRADKKVVLVADLPAENERLRSMIERFQAVLPYECALVNIEEFPFAGGCLGCFHCASDGKCVYKDGFDSFLREKIQSADATIYAFQIREHSMGYRFKMYDDRQFCNGHRTVTMGSPVGYLVDGVLSTEENLRIMLHARAGVGGNYLAGIACDEVQPDDLIDRLAVNLSYALEHGYTQPADFYGAGGKKIFRDLIYQMQGLMREDHRFYKKNGFYDDFPQKHRGKIMAMYLVGGMMRSKKLQKKIGGKMSEGMMMPYRKMLEKAEQGKL
ncbi:MAG: NAD(P)H-dependent oxidoreductase [Lachnospiraceae bacterium]|nr:NAD(P)H-dependent oxidoreductase [Lachnospiraceae bacterium]